MEESTMQTTALGRNPQGFSVTELLVVMVLIGIIAAFGVPALLATIHRAKVEGAVREAAGVVRTARLEAVKRGVPAGVVAQLAEGRLVLFLDASQTNDFAAGDPVLRDYVLPARVDFRAPDAGGDDSQIVFGFNTDGSNGWVLFSSDGSADATGALRVGDVRGNFLELRVDPRATGRVEIRKWDADGSRWLSQGEGGRNWQWR
jgi:prepilin-type N-terminal cleavage/methylation domain-containing protein